MVSGQVRSAISHLSADDCAHLVVAYEPVWAVGSGHNAEPEQAYRVMRLVRKNGRRHALAPEPKRVRGTRVLYGGSVKPDNVESYVELPLCDGCLVGGVELRPAKTFPCMIAVVAEVYGHPATE